MRAATIRRILGLLAMVSVAVGLDQIVKWLVETRLPFQEAVPVLPMLALFRTWNKGIAFSLLDGFDGLMLAVLTGCVVGFVFLLWLRTPAEREIALWGYVLIIGGAIGNLADRLIHGHVIDYVLFYTTNWSFAVFNLADAFISIGATLIVLDELIAWRKWRKLHHSDESGRN